MDKGDGSRSVGRWAWLPELMPGVTKLMAERRRELGDAHVNACWKRGVLELQPGYFYAREGPIAVGTPWAQPSELAAFGELNATRTQALLIIRTEPIPAPAR